MSFKCSSQREVLSQPAKLEIIQEEMCLDKTKKQSSKKQKETTKKQKTSQPFSPPVVK